MLVTPLIHEDHTRESMPFSVEAAGGPAGAPSVAPASGWAAEVAATQSRKITHHAPALAARTQATRHPASLLPGCVAPPPAPTTVGALNTARRAQLRHMQQYNIVSNAPLVLEALVPAGHAAHHHPSHDARHGALSLTCTNLRPVDSDVDSTGRPVRVQSAVFFGGRTMTAALRDPSLSLTTTRTVAHQPAASALESSVALDTAARKYWQTHNFDPLLQRYVDGEKEAAERTAEAEAAAAWRHHRGRSQPPVGRYDTLGRASTARLAERRGSGDGGGGAGDGSSGVYYNGDATGSSRPVAGKPSPWNADDPFVGAPQAAAGAACGVGCVARRRYAHYAAELGAQGLAAQAEGDRRTLARSSRGPPLVHQAAYNVITGLDV